MSPLFKRFFGYYRPHRGLFLLDFSCAVTSGLLELGFPIAVKLFIDTLLPTGRWGLIALASALLLAVYVLNAGLMATVTYWGHMLGINIETEMRRMAFDHLQKLSFGFFDNRRRDTSWRGSPRIWKKSARSPITGRRIFSSP